MILEAGHFMIRLLHLIIGKLTLPARHTIESHIDHLNKLYSITGEPILKKYADRFTKYLNNRIDLT